MGMRIAVAAATLVCLLSGCSSPAPDAEAEPAPAPSVKGYQQTVSAPDEWRTEVWHDVQLKVPASWALGYSPLREGEDALLCGTGPLDQSEKPYVGRPGYGSDMCQGVGLDDLALSGEGVWFGSPLPEGDVLSKSGLHQTTIAVGSSRVTVATFDDEVRQQVLDSAQQVEEDAHGCPVAPQVQRGWPIDGFGEPQSLAVCVYQRDRSSDPWERLWSTSLSRARANDLLAAAESAGPGRPCESRDSGSMVVLQALADDPLGAGQARRDFVVRPDGCASLRQWRPEGESWLELTPALVRPWAVEGVSTYVWHFGLPRALDKYFRSMWG
jgi:hypothetical protein